MPSSQHGDPQQERGGQEEGNQQGFKRAASAASRYSGRRVATAR